jgi:hypothetical protein
LRANIEQCGFGNPDDYVETYYTTDNTTPTTSSKLYSEPIWIDINTNITFFSKMGECTENPKFESYIIDE